MVAPARISVDETRPKDFDLVRLHAQHNDLVQSARLASVLEVEVDTPRSSSIGHRRAPVQRDPGIDQLVIVDERMVRWGKRVEVACDNAATASWLAQEASQYHHLKRTPEMRIERIEMDVKEA